MTTQPSSKSLAAELVQQGVGEIDVAVVLGSGQCLEEFDVLQGVLVSSARP